MFLNYPFDRIEGTGGTIGWRLPIPPKDSASESDALSIVSWQGAGGLELLVGLRILSVSINDDDTVLVFETDKGQMAFLAEGDCCSESWFSAINGLDSLLGRFVLEVRQRPEISVPGTRQEFDELYGYFLLAADDSGKTALATTPNGTCEIEFRNSSNGYYGGSCERLGGPYQGHLRPIKSDFSQ